MGNKKNRNSNPIYYWFNAQLYDTIFITFLYTVLIEMTSIIFAFLSNFGSF